MITQYHERLRKLANHDPSLQQDYGHGVLLIQGQPLNKVTNTVPDLIKLVLQQHDGQLQQLINQGRRRPRTA